MDENYERPSHDYSLDPVLTAAEIGNIDRKATDAVAKNGCTADPTDSPITIAGLGLAVPGPSSLDDAEIIISGGKKLVIQSGATEEVNGAVNIKSGGAVNVKSGGATAFEAGSTISFAADVDPTYDPPRLYTRRGVRLIGATYNGSVGTAIVSMGFADAWVSSYLNGASNVVVTRSLTTLANEHFTLDVPGWQEMGGATLVLVRLRTFGISGGIPTTWPTFEVFRHTDASGAFVSNSLQSGGPTTDVHNSGASAWFSAPAATDIVPNQNAEIDPGTYNYTIRCTPPSQAPSGAQLCVQTVLAVYSVPKFTR